jgi:hypothetical protein
MTVWIGWLIGGGAEGMDRMQTHLEIALHALESGAQDWGRAVDQASHVVVVPTLAHRTRKSGAPPVGLCGRKPKELCMGRPFASAARGELPEAHLPGGESAGVFRLRSAQDDSVGGADR